MKRQEPGDPYHYYVANGDQAKLRIKAVGTTHLVAVVLDDHDPPPPPVKTEAPPWIEYSFTVTKNPNATHRLRCQYSFSPDATPVARYVHQVVVTGRGQPCTYDNIPDMDPNNPVLVNGFRFEVVANNLEC